MQMTTISKYSKISHITSLPIFDLSASNFTIIYSLLQYICNQAVKLNIETTYITLDGV